MSNEESPQESQERGSADQLERRDTKLPWVVSASLLLAALVGWWLFGRQATHVFWMLAAVPGLVAIVNFWVTELPRYNRRARAVDTWLTNLEDVASKRIPEQFQEKAALPSDFDAESETLARFVRLHEGQTGVEQPRFAMTLFGALALTAVFGLAAQLSKGPQGIGIAQTSTPASTPPPTGTPTGVPSHPSPAHGPGGVPTQRSAVAITGGSPQPTPTATPTEPTATKTPTLTSSVRPTTKANAAGTGERVPQSDEGEHGLIYAAYGAYLFCIQLLISRLNAGSISGRFLVRLAMQAAIALVLGYAAGETGAFRAVGSETQSLFLYFVLGLFPTWAWQAIRRKGRDILAPEEVGCESLPLCLVDGIDDGVADRLWELGLADVQHLATADPIDLTLKTSYPPNRVIDWIDQATLIAYTRRKIPAFRQYGIRGAIDFATIYGDSTGRMGIGGDYEDAQQRKSRAEGILKQLATKAELDSQALAAIGRSLFEDENLHILWLLWQQKVPGF